VLDLGDGAAWRAGDGPRIWGAVFGRRLLLGAEPSAGPDGARDLRPVLETLAAAEALRRIVGLTPHDYDVEL
jgi:hypothetical protein